MGLETQASLVRLRHAACATRDEAETSDPRKYRPVEGGPNGKNAREERYRDGGHEDNTPKGESRCASPKALAHRGPSVASPPLQALLVVPLERSPALTCASLPATRRTAGEAVLGVDHDTLRRQMQQVAGRAGPIPTLEAVGMEGRTAAGAPRRTPAGGDGLPAVTACLTDELHGRLSLGTRRPPSTSWMPASNALVERRAPARPMWHEGRPT
jgi:hypothetical protein